MSNTCEKYALFVKTIQSTISEIAPLDKTDFDIAIDILKIDIKGIPNQLCTLQNCILSIHFCTKYPKMHMNDESIPEVMPCLIYALHEKAYCIQTVFMFNFNIIIIVIKREFGSISSAVIIIVYGKSKFGNS